MTRAKHRYTTSISKLTASQQNVSIKTDDAHDQLLRCIIYTFLCYDEDFSPAHKIKYTAPTNF